MAAGLGFKDFTTGEVLTAADVDGYLMQGVWVFASAAARDAAVTSPQEGNFAYLKDTNVTTYYTGSAWANLDTTGMTNPMTTTGDMIYSSSGSTPARLGIGSTGNVLTVSGGVPVWSAPAGGGKLLQVVYATTSTNVNNATTTFADTGLTATITPTSASSTILVIVNQQGLSAGSGITQVGCGLRLLRGSTTIYTPDNVDRVGQQSVASASNITGLSSMMGFTYQDSPATTSSTTYKVQGRTKNTAGGGQTLFQETSASSSIVLMEIGA